jgi:hypothetical protein
VNELGLTEPSYFLVRHITARQHMKLAMYACMPTIGPDFSVGCAGRRIDHLLFATHPYRPALCTGTQFAPLSAPITHSSLQHELRREEPLLPNTSLSRGPREGSAAIVSP